LLGRDAFLYIFGQDGKVFGNALQFIFDHATSKVGTGACVLFRF